MPKYSYDQVPLRGANSLRILTLYPGTNANDDLHCSLEAFTFDVAPRYDALSYVWGPPDRTEIILCEGDEIHITKILDQVLRHIRHDTEDRNIWIDQICINQKDQVEKEHQVQKMRDIYHGANTVVSWLGPDEEDQGHAAKLMLYHLCALEPPPSLSHALFCPTDEKLQLIGLPPRQSPEWEALNALLTNPYFKRIWILQEVLTGSNVVITWGQTKIPWKALVHALLLGYKYSLEAPDRRRLTMEPLPTLSILELMPFTLPLEGWLDLLSGTKHMEATDPKDRVFGLLGLVEETSPLTALTADYQETLGQVYAKVAKRIIQSSKDLSVLSYVFIPDLNKQEGVPTWAPKWDILATLDLPIGYGRGEYAASEGSNFTWKDGSTLNDPSTWSRLSAKGLKVDGVKATGECFHEDFMPRFITESFDLAVRTLTAMPKVDLVRQFSWTMTTGHTTGPEGFGTRAGDTHLEDFISYGVNEFMRGLYEIRYERELLGLVGIAMEALPPASLNIDREYLYQNIRKKLVDTIRPLHLAESTTADIVVDTCILHRAFRIFKVGGTERFQREFETYIPDRKFFTTDNGRMGVGPICMKETDIVCILFGGTVPYILRPTHDGDYLFLGECYVHGIMDGEAMTEFKNGKHMSEWFDLR